MINLFSYLKTRKKFIFTVVASFFFFFALFEVLSGYVTVAFTIRGEECFPYRLWVIAKKTIPQKGQYIAFKNQGLDQRATWVKMVSGVGGDQIRVEKITDQEMRKSPELFRFYVEEIGRELPLQGFVYLHSGSPFEQPEIFRAFKIDTKGRPLPMIEPGVIPEGKLFVSSPAVRSYDSRYWGLIDESEVIGRAYPVF